MHLKIKYGQSIAFFFFFVVLIVTPTSEVFSFSFLTQKISKCAKMEWTKADGRTQGDGWIWFPGKGTDEKLEIAYLKAEGMAISRLIQECIIPHKEVKIHERCDEKIGKFHRAFVRVSLRDIQCRESKYAGKDKAKLIVNHSLMKTYNNYKKLLGITAETDSSKTECLSDKPEKCYNLGKFEFQTGNFQKALEYFDISCKALDYKSCFNAGTSAWSLNLNDKALGYFQMSCDKDDAHACLFVAHLNDISNNPNSRLVKKILAKSCSLSLPEGCFGFGEFYERNKNKLMALNNYKKACNMKFAQGCHNTARRYFDKNMLKQASDFSKKGCELGHKKSCYNYAFIQEKNKNLKSAFKYYEMACDMGLSLGCLEAGRPLLKSDRKRALRFFKEGCELGNKQSCKETATIYYDDRDITSSLRYSKLACKLGELKSCHNSGYLELSQGNKEEAIIFLKSSCSQGLTQSCKLIK